MRAVVMTAAGVALAAVAPAFAAKPVRPLTVSPAPGTPDASPQTQISVLGVAPQRIRSVTARGSLTGAHQGAIRVYSGRRGASFVPARPFSEGETVAVAIDVAGRAPTRYTFAIAQLAAVPPVLGALSLQAAKLDHFVSAPTLLPPRITVDRAGGGRDGDIFLTPLPSPMINPQRSQVITINPVGPGGPMIVDGHGRLVWFGQLPPPMVATNLQLQRYRGRTVLTWWQGTVTAAAFGLGEGVIADSSYRTVETVHTGNGYSADLHEFVLTPSGDALFTVNSFVRVHVPGTAPGALTPVLDAIIQEVDVRTGLVVWEWHSLGHIPLADSYATPATSSYFDAYHLNSIEPVPGNRLLVSARDTSAVYEIDRASGRIAWTLGGKASSFRLGPGARFFFQHDARLLARNRVSLFDDEGGPPNFAASSRGLILQLDLRRRTARVFRQYRRPGTDTLANSEGSVQSLRRADVFVGFGSAPFFSQFTASGRLVFDGSLPADDGSYRAFRYRWRATPKTRPVAVARRLSPNRVAIYVSWNGATDVARWQVLARTAAGRLAAVGSAADRGFETRVEISSGARAFTVRALDRRGRDLGAAPVS